MYVRNLFLQCSFTNGNILDLNNPAIRKLSVQLRIVKNTIGQTIIMTKQSIGTEYTGDEEIELT